MIMIKIFCQYIAFITLLFFVLNTNSFGQCKAVFSIEKACEGDSVIFKNLSQNSDKFIWRFGDGTTSIDHSPKHLYGRKIDLPNATLVALNNNGCTDSITEPVYINQKPNPDFNYSVRHGEIIFDALERFATKYKWYFFSRDSAIDITSSFTYLTTRSRIDSVCLYLENAAGCYDNTCKEIDLQVGIENQNIISDLEFYPNPSNGQFNIIKRIKNINIEWEVVDQYGKSVKKLQLRSGYNSVDLNLISGIYFLKSSQDGWIINRRLVVIN